MSSKYNFLKLKRYFLILDYGLKCVDRNKYVCNFLESVIASNMLKWYLNWNVLPYELEIPQSDRFSQEIPIKMRVYTVLFFFDSIFLENPIHIFFLFLFSRKSYGFCVTIFKSVCSRSKSLPRSRDWGPPYATRGPGWGPHHRLLRGRGLQHQRPLCGEPPCARDPGFGPRGDPVSCSWQLWVPTQSSTGTPGTASQYPVPVPWKCWSSCLKFKLVWFCLRGSGSHMIWATPIAHSRFFFFWFPRQMCQLYCLWQQQFYFPFFMNFKNSIVKSWEF